MKAALIASLCAVATTVAVAQPASPISPGAAPTVKVDSNQGIEGQVKADKARVKADKERLKAARAASDPAAIRKAESMLSADKAALRADQNNAAEAAGGESLKR